MAELIKTKTCRICKQTKSITDFYKESRVKDGYRTECKTCFLKRQGAYNRSIAGRKSQKAYSRSKGGRASLARHNAKRIIRYPEKYKAKSAVATAIKKGIYPRASTLICQYCPNQAEHYHHHKGYAPEHWLDVVPVCKICHSKSRTHQQGCNEQP